MRKKENIEHEHVLSVRISHELYLKWKVWLIGINNMSMKDYYNLVIDRDIKMTKEEFLRSIKK